MRVRGPRLAAPWSPRDPSDAEQLHDQTTLAGPVVEVDAHDLLPDADAQLAVGEWNGLRRPDHRGAHVRVAVGVGVARVVLPRVIDRHRTGRLFQIGSGTKVSLTFIENAAKAHLQACDALDPDRPDKAPAGRAYFVTDDEAVDFWVFISNLLEQLGDGPVRKKLSYPIARAISSMMETAWETFGWAGEPPLTPFVVDQLAQSHWYSSAAAKRDFGYAPDVGHEAALRRTIDALKDRARA